MPRLWASRRVGWLIEQIRLNGETKELKDEVVELGTRYGIVTPYTSYLSTDGTLVQFAPSADALQIMALRRDASRAVAKQKGESAVKMSKQQNSMQANASVANDKKEESEKIIVENSTTNQFVANKNFFNQSNVWVDAEFKSEAKLPEIKVQFASDEFFALIKKEKDLAQYFALGEQVVVVWRNKVYRVVK